MVSLTKKKKSDLVPPTPLDEQVGSEKRIAEGQAFIQEREKRAAQLQLGNPNISNKQAVSESSRQLANQEQANFLKTPEGLAQTSLENLATQNKAALLIERTLGSQVDAQTPLQNEAGAVAGSALSPATQPQLESSQSGDFLATRPNQIGNAGGLLTDRAGGVISFAVKTTAQIVDGVRSVFSGGKQVEAVAAEGALNDVMKALNDDIALVKAGIKSPFDVRQGFARAESFINNLEGTQKGLGKANLRYWLTDGKEVEAKVALEKENLQELKAQLILAERDAQMLQARQNFGI